MHNAVRGVEIVFHLGALGSVPRSVQDPLTIERDQRRGTLNVQLAARDEGVRRVVFASSSSIYGDRIGSRCREDGADAARTVRGRKLAAEQYCVSFTTRLRASRPLSLRYFNVFGPRQDPTSQYAP